MQHPAVDVPVVVLDTNAVLDWLVFGDAAMAALATAVQAGAVRWMACPRMRDELARTIVRSPFAKWSPEPARVLESFDRFACTVPTPATLPALRCDDADDQVFIDLAVAIRARWLVTRDRALLRLIGPAARCGVQIVQPAAWHGAS